MSSSVIGAISVVSVVALSGSGTTSGSSAPRLDRDSIAITKETATATAQIPNPAALLEPVAPVADSRLVLGSPEPGLSFKAPVLLAAGNGLPAAAASSATDSTVSVRSEGNPSPLSDAPTAQSATIAAKRFADAIVAGRTADAFQLLPSLEQQRVGSSAKFAEVLSQDASWLSSAIDRAQTEGEVVALRVTQTPMIDEIHGVIAPSSIVKLPAYKEASGWKVSWERRNISQQFAAPQSRLETDVLRWAASRQKLCALSENSSTAKPVNMKTASDNSGSNKTASDMSGSYQPIGSETGGDNAGDNPSLSVSPEGEYAGGLLGAVWLADELCTVPGATTASTTGDIYSLDDPQPLLDAYGGGSYQWARVVTFGAPHAMHVIAAPLDQRWVVVGIAPVIPVS